MKTMTWQVCYSLLSFALASHACLFASAEEEFCGVEVSVIDSYGQKVPSARAELHDPNGKIEQIERVVNGKARFCDFGFGLYSILVEANPCAAVILKDIEFQYKTRQTFGVVLNDCSWQGDAITNGCFTYVRVSATDGTKLGDVNIEDRQHRKWGTTDGHGRIRLSVLKGWEQEFVFLKDNFKPALLHLECSAAGGGTLHAAVVLPGRK